MPALAYLNAKGEARMLVIPFMKDISQLDGLVYLKSQNTGITVLDELTPMSAHITVSLQAKRLEKDAAAVMNDIGSALGGGDGTGEEYEDLTLLDTTLGLDVLSLDAVDVGYVSCGKSSKGELYMTVMDTAAGIQAGNALLDTGAYQPIKVVIAAELPNGTVYHEKAVQEKENLNQI
jgi:hypothetical protein